MKIGLVAMSGIRVVDAQLLALGLTLPGFVERSKTIASLPSLGLLTLAGMTPRRHRVHYIEVDTLEDGAALPDDLDLVAISSFSAQAAEAYALGRRLRAAGVPVVMGGLHATSLPEEAIAAGLSAAVGEGELVWPDILRDAERGRLAPLYDARARGEFDLAQAPLPRFDLLDVDRYNRLTVQASRGCPWRCSFCASSILLTGRYKQKPGPKVLAEIDAIRALWPRPFIELADDNAFVNRNYWRALLPELAKRKVKWFAETDLSIWQDAELLGLLRDAGCAEVLIGFESPTSAGLEGIEGRCDFKHKGFPDYRQAVARIQSYGIRVNACFVLGLDGHTPEIFDEVYRFAREVTPFDVQITYPTPFPGTPLYAALKAQGRLTHDGQWDRCTLFDIDFRPAPMSAAELRAGFLELTRSLYSEDFTSYRHEAFKRMSRGGRGCDAAGRACAA